MKDLIIKIWGMNTCFRKGSDSRSLSLPLCGAFMLCFGGGLYAQQSGNFQRHRFIQNLKKKMITRIHT